MIARPIAYQGKQIAYNNASGSTESFELDDVDKIRKAIFSSTKLHLSSSNIAGYVQFGFSLPEEDYLKAVEALRTFQGMVAF